MSDTKKPIHKFNVQPVSKVFKASSGTPQVLVNVAVSIDNGAEEYKPMLVTQSDIARKLHLSDEYSVLIMQDGLKIPVKMKFQELIEQLSAGWVSENGYIDWTDVTGQAATPAPEFHLINGAVEIKKPTSFNPDDIQVKLWGRGYRDKGKYTCLEFAMSNISSVENDSEDSGLTYIKFYLTVKGAYGSDSKRAWFDMHVTEFQNALDQAKIKKLSRLNLLDQTSKNIPGRPEGPERPLRPSPPTKPPKKALRAPGDE